MTLRISTGNILSIRSVIDRIPDPLDNRGKKYDIHESVILVIIGFLSGKTDYTNMAHYLKLRETELKKYMSLKNGVPSHDTLSRHIALIDDKELIYALCDWFAQLIGARSKQHIIIDGKGLRAAADKVQSGDTPYIMNVIDQGSKMVLAQLKVGEKTNEITALPEVLDMIDLKENTVTIDAIGTQTKVMNKIIRKKGNFVLPVKENQKLLCSEIDLQMNDLIESNDQQLMKLSDDVQIKHGRVEKRKYYLINNNDCIMDKKKFKHIESVGMVIRERNVLRYKNNEEINQKTEQKVYYVCSRKMEVDEFANYVRNHWTIENSLHWVLDNIFKEDRSTVKSGKENLSLIRKAAYNIITWLKNDKEDCSYEYVIDELQYNLDRLFETINEPLTI